jgi:hypothetical protein
MNWLPSSSIPVVSWRASITNRYKEEWKNLLIRLSLPAVGIAFLTGAEEAARSDRVQISGVRPATGLFERIQGSAKTSG